MIDMTMYAERARIEGEYIVTGYNKHEKRMFKKVEPSYDLGYVIGAYLSVGSVNLITYNNSTRGIVFWYVENNGFLEKVEKLENSLKSSFNLSLNSRSQKKSSTYQLVCYSKPLATLLSNLGKKSGVKRLPDKYFFDDVDYRKGLLHGIEDFKGHVPDSRDILKKRKVSIDVVLLYEKLKSY